jgi:hypothetical protein
MRLFMGDLFLVWFEPATVFEGDRHDCDTTSGYFRFSADDAASSAAEIDPGLPGVWEGRSRAMNLRCFSCP